MEAIELGIEYLKKAFEKNPGKKQGELNAFIWMRLTWMFRHRVLFNR